MNKHISVFNTTKTVGEYIVTLLKWLGLSVCSGIVCGLSGTLFHYCVDIAAHLRSEFPFILFFLPVAGVVIVFLYHVLKKDNDKGTNTIIEAVRSSDKISLLTYPLILISTTLTHLCGGSSGREGAALQIGGSVGSLFSRLFRLKKDDTSVMIMCSMSGLFAAVFGTPITAGVFSLEVVSVGIMHYGALFPCLLTAIIAFNVAQIFGVHATFFTLLSVPDFDYVILLKVICLSACTALVSILFIFSMHKTTHLSEKYLKNKYIRIIVGAFVVILITFLIGSQEYNGAGMDVIQRALEEGAAHPLAFIIKLILTVITLSAGFKGGEIVPSFFIGATFGVFMAPIIGLNPSFAAAIGLVALFCGVVNCPLATIILSLELFGIEGLLYYSVAVATSYIVSGYFSLYSSQRIVYSKLRSVVEHVETPPEKQ